MRAIYFCALCLITTSYTTNHAIGEPSVYVETAGGLMSMFGGEYPAIEHAGRAVEKFGAALNPLQEVWDVQHHKQSEFVGSARIVGKLVTYPVHATLSGFVSAVCSASGGMACASMAAMAWKIDNDVQDASVGWFEKTAIDIEEGSKPHTWKIVFMTTGTGNMMMNYPIPSEMMGCKYPVEGNSLKDILNQLEGMRAKNGASSCSKPEYGAESQDTLTSAYACTFEMAGGKVYGGYAPSMRYQVRFEQIIKRVDKGKVVIKSTVMTDNAPATASEKTYFMCDEK